MFDFGEKLTNLASLCSQNFVTATPGTHQTQIQETAFSVQIVPGMRFLVFKFAVSEHTLSQYRASRSRRLVPYAIAVPHIA
eukprot:3082213-Rhodomonas_salina.1